MHSIHYVKREIERGRVDSLIDPENKDAISANLLESFVEMNEFTQNSKIEIAATWAPTIPLPTDVPSVVEISNDVFLPFRTPKPLSRLIYKTFHFVPHFPLTSTKPFS